MHSDLKKLRRKNCCTEFNKLLTGDLSSIQHIVFCLQDRIQFNLHVHEHQSAFKKIGSYITWESKNTFKPNTSLYIRINLFLSHCHICLVSRSCLFGICPVLQGRDIILKANKSWFLPQALSFFRRVISNILYNSCFYTIICKFPMYEVKNIF